jgi:hypothetical protein
MLAHMPAAERDGHCDRLDAIIGEHVAPERFVRLRQAAAGLAQCPMIDTLARSIVSYQARSYGELPEIGPSRIFAAMQREIVAQLRSCDIAGTEQAVRGLLDRVDEAIAEGLGVLVAAE